jgi:hypothetical protein
MIKTPLSWVRVAVCCLPLALVASCGSETEAVQGTAINMDPPTIAQDVPANGQSTIINEVVTIEARTPTGAPQIGIQLMIDSLGTLSRVDKSGNLVTFTPMGAAGTAYLVTTDNNGVFTVAVTFTSPGTGADGEVTILSAWSGTGYNRLNITYSCFDVGGTTCP